MVTKDAIGTGVVVSPKGHILTNWHVAEGNEVVGVVPRNRDLLAKIPVGNGPHGLALMPLPGRYSLGHTGITR